MKADSETLRTAYRTDQITETRHLAGVPMIGLRGYSEAGEVHTSNHSYGMRARFDQRNGTHAHQLIWTFAPVAPVVTVPTGDQRGRGVHGPDRWLTAIEADVSDQTPGRKVFAKTPADDTDRCIVGGQQISTSPTCDGATPPFDDARGVAGRAGTNDVVTCRLKPLRASDYATPLTPAQLQSLRAAFPGGACDWSKPSVRQQPQVPWLTFAAGPGGVALAPPSRCRSAGGASRGTLGYGRPRGRRPGRPPARHRAASRLTWLALGLVLSAAVVRTRAHRPAAGALRRTRSRLPERSRTDLFSTTGAGSVQEAELPSPADVIADNDDVRQGRGPGAPPRVTSGALRSGRFVTSSGSARATTSRCWWCGHRVRTSQRVRDQPRRAGLSSKP